MKRFMIVSVMTLATLLTLLFGDVDVSSAQTDCIFVNPNFNVGDGGWALGLNVEQFSGYVGMPNFSTIGQDVYIRPGDYNLVLSVFIWKEPETIIAPDDLGNIISFYYQIPATGAWVRLEPFTRSFSQFASESGDNIHQTFSIGIHTDAVTTGTFTIFTLVSAPVEGVEGVAVDRACLEQALPPSSGGGGDTGCDVYLPCGPIPWQIPSLPDLQSPTPFPSSVPGVPTWALTLTPAPSVTPVPTSIPPATAGPTFTPFPTLTPHPTYTLMPTWTPMPELAEFSDAMHTLQAMVDATQIPIYDVNGTPVSMDTVTDLADNTGTIFSYARGLSEINFGVLTPLMTFMFIALVVFIFVKVLIFLLPVFAALLGLLRKILQMFFDFIPG